MISGSGHARHGPLARIHPMGQTLAGVSLAQLEKENKRVCVLHISLVHEMGELVSQLTIVRGSLAR